MRLYAFIVLLTFLSTSVTALRGEATVRANRFADVASFGFEKGGKLTLHTTDSSFGVLSNLGYVKVKFLVCTAKQWKQFVQISKHEHSCHGFEVCEFYSEDGSFEYTVKEKDLYHIGVISCRANSHFKLGLNYTMQNPGGVELALGDEHLPDFYYKLTFVWTGMAVLWSCLVIYYRDPGAIIQVALGVCMLLSALLSLGYAFFWTVLGETGNSLLVLVSLLNLGLLIGDTILLLLLSLISEGWNIFRRGLYVRHAALAFVPIFVVSTFIFFSRVVSLFVLHFFSGITILYSLKMSISLLETKCAVITSLREDSAHEQENGSETDSETSHDGSEEDEDIPLLPGQGDIEMQSLSSDNHEDNQDTDEESQLSEQELVSMKSKIRSLKLLMAVACLPFVSFGIIAILNLALPWYQHWFVVVGVECVRIGFVLLVALVLRPGQTNLFNVAESSSAQLDMLHELVTEYDPALVRRFFLQVLSENDDDEVTKSAIILEYPSEKKGMDSSADDPTFLPLAFALPTHATIPDLTAPTKEV